MSALTFRRAPGLGRVTFAFMRKDFRFVLPALAAAAIFLVFSLQQNPVTKFFVDIALWTLAVHWWMRDPVGDVTAFWTDRALSTRTLVLAKAVGLFLTVAPLVLATQGFVLWRLGVTGSWWVESMLQSTLYLTVIVVLTGALSVVVTSSMHLVVGLLVGAIAFYVVTMVLAWFRLHVAAQWLLGAHLESDVTRMVVVLVIAVVTIVLGLRRPRGTGRVVALLLAAYATMLLLTGLGTANGRIATPVPGPASTTAHVRAEVSERSVDLVIDFDVMRPGAVFPLDIEVVSRLADGTVVAWKDMTTDVRSGPGITEGGGPFRVRLDDHATITRLRAEPSELLVTTTRSDSWVTRSVHEATLTDEPHLDTPGEIAWVDRSRDHLYVRRLLEPDERPGLDARNRTLVIGIPGDGGEARRLPGRGESSWVTPVGVLMIPRIFEIETIVQLGPRPAAAFERLLLIETAPSSSAYLATIRDFRIDDAEAGRTLVLHDQVADGRTDR